MITEPELTGGSEESGPDVIGDAGDRPPGRLARRRHWTWGAGGLLVASVLWMIGLHVYDDHRDTGPDLHGYALGASPCSDGSLDPLTRALGATDSEAVTPAAAHLGPALDQIHCTLSVGSRTPGTVTSRYQVFVTIDLHKSTDPRAEFDDQRGLDTGDLNPAEADSSVPGIGDEAYLLTISSQTEELRVRHGGAVFSVTLTGFNDIAPDPAVANSLQGTPPSPDDLSRYRSALVASMRDVMAAQRRH
ncbi:hypothetical protein SAMN05216223_105408 [Actinacidiphila yanglinensis]|uniref:DUF3558 domain-containing protein n=1 Tax=Actinacidiphila yanglinensis TaxID=310779 RepID=A0A1H6AI26_9ACTN|nr:hypothetical protein [Actinacidiphila yanglinensis]SEG48032.1 hypothetical protein SAMN05216223_105408 [Actinacidiphila yanglinensis]